VEADVPLATLWGRTDEAAGAAGLRGLLVDCAGWREAANGVAAAGGRLLALWGDTSAPDRPAILAVYVARDGALRVELPLAGVDERYPGIDDVYPAACRMQRAVFDLHGLRSTSADERPWLRHAPWPSEFHPLRQDSGWASRDRHDEVDDYSFVRVEGEGVHEVPVGPVHAGIIEPGHFRFSIVGEKVLRLEERLGYVHKGIERRFESLPLCQGHRLAARVSGDSAVAFSWAYCQALEAMADVQVPPRGAWLRALVLELERIANHLGDLGALGNDAGFAFGLAQFWRLKEDLLRALERSLGQRYLLDFVVPGGTARDIADDQASVLADEVAALAGEVELLRAIYEDHAGLRDRFADAGTVRPDLASRLGLVGLAGRASGQQLDLRVDLPCRPYDELRPVRCDAAGGDVLARVTIRFDELTESCRLVRTILGSLPDGAHVASVTDPPEGRSAIGMIEGWRGPVVLALTSGGSGMIRRCHPQDPSWLGWPVLEHAIIGNIVPDFPLINKSFNFSYSGHDL
jgi:Ni,Fe-hydrogenase III large subunit